MRRNNSKAANGTAANLGFEAKLWAAADALRNNMDAAEYKHVVLGLIFLKYIFDAFEAKHAELETQKAQGADPEDPDEYRATGIFWVPKEARWSSLKANAPQPTIGTLVDDAMTAIERDNPTLKGVLPKDFGRAGLDKQRLGQIINLVSDIVLNSPRPSGEGLGVRVDRTKDTLGRVYEYFLARFASAEGKSLCKNSPRKNMGLLMIGCLSRQKSRDIFYMYLFLKNLVFVQSLRAAGSSTHPRMWCGCWWRCSPPTRAASTTPAAVPAACSCRAKSSSRRTPASSATSLFTARSRTTPPGALRR